jgi:hypothetical protein
MGRFFYGALVGGALMYLFDPENGNQRREQLQEWWRKNQGTVKGAGRATVRKVQDLQPMVERATRSASWTPNRTSTHKTAKDA